MIENICPIHKHNLLCKKTRFGKRFYCPENDCTVVRWNGQTSTSADYKTRQARIEAHNLFDDLWKVGDFNRAKLYKQLAKHLGLEIKNTHIGHFNIEQCQQTVEFAKVVHDEEEK